MPVHDIHMFPQKHQLAYQYHGNQAVSLLLMERKVCAVPIRRHHPSAGHNKPSGGNRE